VRERDRQLARGRGANRVARPLLMSVACALTLSARSPAQEVRQLVSGIYPHLAMFNDENECGTGAVVSWAERLWVVTYAPHKPRGSSDKLYEIDAGLAQTIRPESVGGTPANRMIHRESQQLFIGPYVIDRQGEVRVIPYSEMFGRPTANARHLSDPANKIYCATMEEGLYAIDVRSLEVEELWADEQRAEGRHSDLPGYHGKGLYSGQGRLVYANNGEHGARALRDPTTPSGALAEWDGEQDEWRVIRRSQFTEVTGPGGIFGSQAPATDPIWSIGWDHRSLLLEVLDQGRWHTYRLPKGSHSYDGAHGWNTEWPRIRDIGEDDLLMTMHGLFWRFPREFRPGNTGGLRARSAYLKVVGDFCRWGQRVVFGCDDTARSEFLNKRRAKGAIAAPRSQSNLWFVEPEEIGALGPVRAVGGVWVHEEVGGGTVSDALLVSGFGRRGLHLAHSGKEAAEVVLEVDPDGLGQWRAWQTVTLPAFAEGGYLWRELPADLQATWLRLRSPGGLHGATAYAHFASSRRRSGQPAARFDGLAKVAARQLLGGPMRARGGKKTSLALAAQRATGAGVEDLGCYELDLDAAGERLVLNQSKEAGLHEHTLANTKFPTEVVTVDAASVLVVDDRGDRWRLPKHSAQGGGHVFGSRRVAREVATERDLLHAAGTFYELPAENAGGFRKLRPVASHGFLVHDYCSYRGMLVISGLRPDAAGPHVVRSEDGHAALWVGAIDDLWEIGRPRGHGGPWWHTSVAAGERSDPYLATGYDVKTCRLSHDLDREVVFTMEADVCGDGRWVKVQSFRVPAQQVLAHTLPQAWSAYWVRFYADAACAADAVFVYR
jgi:hypothetical protein